MTINSAQRLIATVAPELADAVRLRIDDALPSNVGAVAMSATGEIAFSRQAVTPGVVVHELAHLLATPRTNVDSEIARSVSAVPGLAVALQLAARDADPEVPRWAGHGDRWIRCVVHMLSRTVRTGLYEITPGSVQFAGEFYGLSSSLEYIAALGDEPQRMHGWPFSKILATDPPAAFTQLWREDTK